MVLSFTEFESTKNLKRLFMMLCCIISSVFLLSGCDAYYNTYPFDEECEWACQDPSIVLSYTYDAEGKRSGKEVLTWNNSTIELQIGFRASSYDAYPKGNTGYASRLFSGSWRYEKDYLILTIEEDYIFDDQYNELVFETSSNVKLPEKYVALKWGKVFGVAFFAVVFFVLPIVMVIRKMMVRSRR